jgi:hypothetical protein
MAKNHYSESHECDWCWFPCADLLNQLIILLVGIVLLLINVGILDAAVLTYWPLLLIIVALRALMRR